LIMSSVSVASGISFDLPQKGMTLPEVSRTRRIIDRPRRYGNLLV